jgi:hypothetical protein
MKAEQRKEIETNSLVLAVQRLRKHISGRTLYYFVGILAVIAIIVGFYYYFASERRHARDAILLQLATADNPEKLKAGMEEHRGTVYGSLFKLHLARHQLRNEGLPKLGTDNSTARLQAANSVDEARKNYLDLTSEFKEKDDPAFLQEAWFGAAAAEEALVGVAKPDNQAEFRGNVDKALEYYDKGAAILPDAEFTKRHKAWADKIRANKEMFVADQKEIFKPTPSLFSSPPPVPKSDSPFPGLPPFPKGDVPSLPFGPPPPPTPDSKAPVLPKLPDAKLPDSKPADVKPPEAPKPADPKKTPETKPADPPKSADPKAK